MSKIKSGDSSASKKKTDKALVITVICCVAVVLIVVLTVLLYKPIVSEIEKGHIEKFITESNMEMVVIEDPLALGEDVASSARVVLENDEANAFSDRLLLVLKNTKYSHSTSLNVGIWKTNIKLYNGNTTKDVYIDEDGIYIEINGNLVAFEVKKNTKDQFNDMLAEIEAALKQL